MFQDKTILTPAEVAEYLGIGRSKCYELFRAKLLYHAYVLKESGMDKYYHSVANCQSAQFGDLEEEAAIELSNFKEEFDQYNNNYATSHKLTLEQALADSERDQVANRLGRERGRNNPTCDCRVLMRDVLPKNKR